MLHIRKGVLRTETILWATFQPARAEKNTDETLTYQLEGGGGWAYLFKGRSPVKLQVLRL